MALKELAFEKISELVTKFSDQLPAYKKSDYNETLTRKDFIDPFFEALGWDINNKAGSWEAYREVIHEDRLKIGGVTSAPDYSFRLIGGQRLFFVEAKKPSILIKDDVAPAYQVRLYGWNAKLAISVVTDFEEFAIYDCSKKPVKTDKASKARLNYFTYKDYIDQFDFFWNTFSKEQVIKGGLIKFQQSDKKGTATVDKAFLESLDEWRKLLAANIYKNNPDITEDELNYSVQQTIDRIIFLRISEDRGLEPYGQLKSSLQTADYYQELYRQFRVADDKYNSGLFHFRKEKENNETPDSISGRLIVDNKVIKAIISSLYPPHSDYLFSVLPVEILGSAYEQFLGKQIVVKGSKAIIEDKPEVRKAGGVYYTPQYIVNYIVEQTLGQLCKDKTPKEVTKIKVVDPACGSGSFLLGAYQYLLDWHTDYYSKNPVSGRNKEAVLTPEGTLTTAEKKKILINNLFGVDIDRNAVEVTKLSLLLKCMEGETGASINTQMTFFHERVLPSLEKNIKCGNSLVDLDFYDTELDFGEDKKVKPFNWQQQFPEVFMQGGFDVVIGNPPYIKIQGLQEFQPEVVEYFKLKYKAAQTGSFDIYVLFDEMGYGLLKKEGLLGFIQPHKFFQAEFGEGIRDFLSNRHALNSIVNFGAEQVFGQATTYTCILVLRKAKNLKVSVSVVTDLDQWASKKIAADNFLVPQPQGNEKWNFSNASKSDLLSKLKTNSKTLSEVTRKIFVGLQTSADKIYILKVIEWNAKTVICYSTSLNQNVEIERGLVKPFLLGKDLKKYQLPKAKNVVIFPYVIQSGKAVILEKKFIKENYPLGWEYIRKNKEALENRENGKMKTELFYSYIYPKNLTEFECKKIMTPDIANHSKFTIDNVGNLYHTTTIYSFAFKDEIKESPNYFLGLFNSPILWYFLTTTGNVLRGGFFRFKTEYLKPFPVKLINWKVTEEKDLHSSISSLVEQILELNNQKEKMAVAEKVSQIEQRIEFLEEKKNKLVYQLYGLTEEEIAIVEGKANG